MRDAGKGSSTTADPPPHCEGWTTFPNRKRGRAWVRAWAPRGYGGIRAGRGGGDGLGSSPGLSQDRSGGRTWVGAWATPRAGSRVLDLGQMPSAGLGPGWARDAGSSRVPGTCGS